MEAWASMKSFRRKDEDSLLGDGGRSREADFRGELRRNETHQPATDPESKLAKRGLPPRLSCLGHSQIFVAGNDPGALSTPCSSVMAHRHWPECPLFHPARLSW